MVFLCFDFNMKETNSNKCTVGIELVGEYAIHYKSTSLMYEKERESEVWLEIMSVTIGYQLAPFLEGLYQFLFGVRDGKLLVMLNYKLIVFVDHILGDWIFHGIWDIFI